jgi:cadmium resistance transport/sequestration family protein
LFGPIQYNAGDYFACKGIRLESQTASPASSAESIDTERSIHHTMTSTELITVVITAAVVFAATNMDDIIILTLFFSQTNENFRRWHVVAGQYLGFSALIAISLLGYLTGLIIPKEVIGLLGFLPIAIGIGHWRHRNDVQENLPAQGVSKSGVLSAVTSVAAVTFANGGDNIGIYMPLFATSCQTELIIILIVFYILVGVWCMTGNFLTRQPSVGRVLTRYGHVIVPFVLIGLGIFILIKSDAYTLILGLFR